MRKLVPGVLALAAMVMIMACPVVGQAAEDCGEYKKLIEEFMPPQVGNQRALAKLLAVKGEDWPSALDLEGLFKSLGETEFRSQSFKGYNVGLMKGDRSMLRYNLVQGKLKYVNKSRAFNAKEPGKAFDMGKGRERVLGLIGTLGLPESEVPLDNIQGQVLNGAVARQREVKPRMVYDIETSFFVPRLVNDIAVMQSIMVVGISNEGEVAQFRANWPPLKIDPELLNRKAIAMDEVAQKVHDRLVEEQGCEDLEKFSMFLAYAPGLQDRPDEDDKVPEVGKPILYAPKLLVGFLPPKGEEAGSFLEFDILR